MSTDKKNIALIGIGVVALIAAIQFNLNRVRSFQNDTVNNDAVEEAPVGDLGEADMASLAKSKVTRETPLGQPQQKAAADKAKKELDILLADPAMSQKWDLSSTQAAEAWSKHRAIGSRNVKVCVIDTGADVKHPDLKNNLWTNPGETGLDAKGHDKATNGIDDDGNGYIDDIHGFNFVGNNNDLSDHHGHGTHIAGIIGAEGGNGIGVSGVSPLVSLVIAKYYDPNAATNNNLINTVRAIRYCVAVKSDIINYSGGGLEPSDKEREAVALARDRGILFVAAAGNEQSNSDFKKYYPADYGLDNIISVTAFDRETNVLPSSNYGVQSVDIAAPGKNIYSTLPGGNYGYMTGTSQATAVVSGVAALIRARFTDFDATRIIRHITETGDWEPIKLNGKTKNQKRLNAYRALAILDQGVTVSGAVPKNAVNLNAAQFSVSTQDLANDGSSVTVSPDGLNGFKKDLQKMIKSRENKNAAQE
jgi:thermitase